MSSERFVVTKAQDDAKNVVRIPSLEDESFNGSKAPSTDNHRDERNLSIDGEARKGSLTFSDHLALTKPPPALALYEEEFQHRPHAATFLEAITKYSAAPQGAAEHEKEENENMVSVKSAKLGTIMGVYLPCVQNILGVILFVRMSWIVGLAGIVEGFFIVFLCVCTTLLTSISMSAIATNGVVPAGGSYFMISRALGPEFGGAVGLLFYLGTTYASSLYILGAVEILLTYISPEMSLFGEFIGPENRAALFNNYRVYGTIFLALMSLLVFVGVSLVNKFASVFLACVITSIISIYAGILKSAINPPDVKACFIGDRLIRQVPGGGICAKDYFNSTSNITEPSSLYQLFCTAQNGSWSCDPYFEANNLSEIRAIPGLGQSVGNARNHYLILRDPIKSLQLSSIGDDEYTPHPDIIVADLTSSFTVLLAIFFPSVTGIMAGSNRSGDLKDGQRSIPKGTIGAVLTTGFIYLSCVVLFGLSVDGAILRDKFGESLGDELIVSIISWPSKWVVLFGAFLSTIGAGLQSLTGAPRLLQAIAQDDIIPILKIFGRSKKNGEPTWSLLLTCLLSCTGIIIANLDLVAPIITMFFLMCYMFVNLACALHSLLNTPNWRPRYKFYHWFLSLIGVCLCITLMFISSWYYAVAAMFIAAAIYKYIEYSGAEKEWGDGLTGLQLTTARFALMHLENGPPHTKNWRPQLLVILKLDENHHPLNTRVLAFVRQLKAGKGLTVVASVIVGDSLESSHLVKPVQDELAEAMNSYRTKGFQQVLVAQDECEGVSALIQSAGLGGLCPNTVVVCWPTRFKKKLVHEDYASFLRAIREASAYQNAVLVLKYVDNFPMRSDPFQSGTIDVWWIVHDGGLLMLLPFLLGQNKMWRTCKTRIFTVAQMQDNSVQMKKDLVSFLYQLRIVAEVEVIEMPDSDISAYTYDRTLRMEQRTQILQKLRMSRKESLKDIYEVMERSRSVSRAHAFDHHHGADRGERPEPILAGSVRGKESITVQESSQMTWTSGKGGEAASSNFNERRSSSSRPQAKNVRRMHTALRLNEAILEKSKSASLVILNLPGPPKGSDHPREANYMEFLEVLTEGLERVVLVRGSGREVITIYS